MIITWIGHACFRIEKDGFSIVFDPYEDAYVPGLKNLREKANMVICSHGHGDHAAVNKVELEEEAVCPFIITSMDSFHDDQNGSLRGENKITLLDDGDIRLAHFGDLGCEPSPEIMTELMDIDVALVPVGGFYTIDGERAAGLSKKLNIKTIIPMHYRDDLKGFGFDKIGTIDSFVEAMGGAEFVEESIYDTAEGKSGVVVLTPRDLK